MAGFGAEGFDNELMIFALGQAGYGDSADDARAGEGDRERSAVGGKFI